VLTINYQKWDHEFTSITAYYEYDSSLRDDDANVRSWRNSNTVLETFDQFSQELRVTSPVGGRIEYLGGVYYQSNHTDSTLQTAAPFTDAFFSGNPDLVPFLPWAFEQVARQDEDLLSVFGSVSWNVTDDLKLNVGLRGTSVDKDRQGVLHYGTATQLFGGFVRGPADFEAATALIGPPGETESIYEDDAWMPSVSVQYQLDPAAMLYASYARGFKAGGAVNDVSTFDSEYVNAYEAGLKSMLFDNRLLFNIGVFLGDYKDLQVQTFIFLPATGTYLRDFRNAAESKSQGVELEAELAVTDGLRVRANITYLDAHYASYPNAQVTPLQRVNGLPVQDLSGQPTDYAPKWSGNVAASYSAPVTDGYEATFEMTSVFSSGFYTSFGTADPLAHVSGYGRIDARLSLAAVGRYWTVDLIAKNLTDRLIPIQREIEGFARKEEPRNVAVQFRYAF
jgi:outer membrane receptor protein involved in Fe transport